MKIKKFGIPFGMLILYFILSNLEFIVFYFVKSNSLIVNNIYLVLFSLVTFGIIIFLSKNNWSTEWQKFKQNKKQYMSLAVKYWLVGFIYMFITNIIINTVILKGISPNEAANRELLDSYRYYSILSTALLAPIMEEILFRLNFKGLFKDKNTFIYSTGLLFAAMHLLSSSSIAELIYIIPYACLGIAFSKIYADTDNIFPSIFMHILHNSLTLFIILGGI